MFLVIHRKIIKFSALFLVANARFRAGAQIAIGKCEALHIRLKQLFSREVLT